VAREAREDSKKREIENLGGLRAYNSFKFETYKRTLTNSKLVDGLKKFDPAKDNAFIFGSAGCGKTHIATAAIRGHGTGRVVKSVDILSDLYRADLSERDGILDKYATLSPVVIDDIGTEKDTEFAVQSFLTIIDRRWMNLRNGLIVTSNLGPNDLTKKFGDDRIVSRLVDMCEFYSLTGSKDYRIK